MRLIQGTDIIDNAPNEKAGELAEAIFDDVVFLLDLEEKCIIENEDGSYNTELGQDLFNGIYEQCMVFFEKEITEKGYTCPKFEPIEEELNYIDRRMEGASR